MLKILASTIDSSCQLQLQNFQASLCYHLLLSLPNSLLNFPCIYPNSLVFRSLVQTALDSSLHRLSQFFSYLRFPSQEIKLSPSFFLNNVLSLYCSLSMPEIIPLPLSLLYLSNSTLLSQKTDLLSVVSFFSCTFYSSLLHTL